MILETYLFAKKLENYKESCNKVDKNFASILLNAVTQISDFLNDATIQEDDEKANFTDIIPHIESDILQAHRNYFCKACNCSVRASPKAFNEHLFGNKHLKRLREYESALGSKMKQSSTEGSIQAVNKEAVGMKPSKKQQNSLKNTASGPKVDDKLSKTTADFIQVSIVFDLKLFNSECL